MNARHLGRLTSALAGGQTIEEDVYLVDFPFDGRPVLAEATFVLGTEILVGTRLLREHRLKIDFVAYSWTERAEIRQAAPRHNPLTQNGRGQFSVFSQFFARPFGPSSNMWLR